MADAHELGGTEARTGFGLRAAQGCEHSVAHGLLVNTVPRFDLQSSVQASNQRAQRVAPTEGRLRRTQDHTPRRLRPDPTTVWNFVVKASDLCYRKLTLYKYKRF